MFGEGHTSNSITLGFTHHESDSKAEHSLASDDSDQVHIFFEVVYAMFDGLQVQFVGLHPAAAVAEFAFDYIPLKAHWVLYFKVAVRTFVEVAFLIACSCLLNLVHEFRVTRGQMVKTVHD